jgi:general secretion pathway protein I
MTHRRTAGRDDGFTLIEVLVAFTIVTLLLSGIMKLLSTGLTAAQQTRTYSEALLLAESSLDQLGAAIPLADGETSDRLDDRFTRRIRILRRPDERQNQPRAINADRLALYDVAVTVQWRSGWRTSEVTLQSVRLAAR